MAWPSNFYTHDRDVAMFCEGDTPSSIPLPDAPSVYISKRCADSDAGRGLTRGLVDAATVEYLIEEGLAGW